MYENPLTAKGRKILAAMKREYGAKKGTQVFYASKNKGTITGVEENPVSSGAKVALGALALAGVAAGLYYATRPAAAAALPPGSPVTSPTNTNPTYTPSPAATHAVQSVTLPMAGTLTINVPLGVTMDRLSIQSGGTNSSGQAILGAAQQGTYMNYTYTIAPAAIGTTAVSITWIDANGQQQTDSLNVTVK